MQHGEAKFDTEGQLVFCQPIGAFNLEGVTTYEEDFLKLITTVNSKPWALLNIYSEFEICGPEVTQRLNKQLKWCHKNGCDHVAFVTFNAVQDYFVKQVTSGITFKYQQSFTDTDEAKATLMAAYQADQN